MYETLCNNHNQIIWNLKQFKKTGDINLINDSIEISKYCKKQGQRMENRMKQYRNSIEKLGFTRNGGRN
jgi:hypothetical protein